MLMPLLMSGGIWLFVQHNIHSINSSQVLPNINSITSTLEGLTWDAVAGPPFIRNVDGDGYEDMIGRYRVLNPDQLWVGAFSGADFHRFWRAGPYGGWSDYQHILVAAAGARILVTDAHLGAHVLDLATGREVGSVGLSDRAAAVCADEGAASPRFFVGSVDGQGLLIEGDPPQGVVSRRPPWCHPLGMPVRWERRRGDLPVHQTPRVRGFAPQLVLGARSLAVAVGIKHPGTPIPMLVGFDPARRQVQWNRVLSTGDAQAAADGSAGPFEMLGDTLYAYYALHDRTEGGHAIAIDARTGVTRWDVIVPHSAEGGPPDAMAATERRVYIPHWTWLDVLDAQNGAVLGTIGR
jgi:hypothetical protein